jgi:hypothetical protein
MFVIPSELRRLCLIDGFSTPDNNPYFTTASNLAWIYGPAEITPDIGHIFIGQMHQPFKDLLQANDPIALFFAILVVYRNT